MEELAKNKELLEDLVGETVSGEFRDQLSRVGYTHARRRKRRKSVRGVVLLAFFLVLLGKVTFGPNEPAVYVNTRLAGERSYVEIRSKRFSNVITSEPFTTARVIASVRPAFPVLETSNERTYREISDSQLLSFFEGQQVVLVRRERTSAELLFVE